MCKRIDIRSGINHIDRCCMVKGEIGIRGICDRIIPFGEKHYTFAAGHSEERSRKLSAVSYGRGETMLITYTLENSTELLLYIAVENQKVSIAQFGKIVYRLEKGA